MPTDDELITALRRGMQDTTSDLNPAPGLAAEVRPQRRKARGRRLAAYVAVPVVAAAATATALLVSGGSPASAPVAEAPVVSSSTPVTPSTSGVTASPAAYKFAKIKPLRSCPSHSAAGSVGKSNSGPWLVTPSGQCFSFTVDWGDGPPADAKPLNIPGYPDLYGVTADAIQKFYLRIAPGVDSYHPKGGWVVTTIAADGRRRQADLRSEQLTRTRRLAAAVVAASQASGAAKPGQHLTARRPQARRSPRGARAARTRRDARDRPASGHVLQRG
jgi:hypothetical protein